MTISDALARYAQWAVCVVWNHTLKEMHFLVCQDHTRAVWKNDEALRRWNHTTDEIDVDLVERNLPRYYADKLVKYLRSEFVDGLEGYRVLQGNGSDN